jgi:integrase/recombinase XerD
VAVTCCGPVYRQSNPYQLKPRIPLTASDLFIWSINRLDKIDAQPAATLLGQATEFRQALMVGLLISAPVRSRAFLNMTVTRHLDQDSNGFILRFAAEDMKDGKARSFPVPNRLTRPLARYVETYRPALLQGRVSDALWITQRGNRMSADSFSGGLALLTKRHFGLTLRPHAFRSIAATSIAEYAPEHVGIIRDVLGHASLDMAERHYNRASGVHAGTRLQALMDDIRRESKKVGRSRHRRRGRH